jgi:ribosomal protein S3
MSRLGNLSTLRIGFTQNWKSNWYEPVSPSLLLFQDFKIRDYLSGIFYKLKAPTSSYHLTWISASMLLIRWEVYWNVSFRLNNFLFRSYWLKSNQLWKMLYIEDHYVKLLSSLVYLNRQQKTIFDGNNLKKWLLLNSWSKYLDQLYYQELIWLMVYVKKPILAQMKELPSYVLEESPLVWNESSVVLTRGELIEWNLTSIYRLIEKSVESYVQQNVFCMVHNYLWRKPAITNAKMVADYVMYTLEKGFFFKKIFEKLKKWQKKNYYRGRMKSKNRRSRRLNMLRFDAKKRTSCLGMKIECLGTSKKGRRAKLTAYADWIRDPRYSHRMPNNTFSADIDYYQTYAVKRSSTIGVKVWVFFQSKIQNQSRRYVSLLV